MIRKMLVVIHQLQIFGTYVNPAASKWTVGRVKDFKSAGLLPYDRLDKPG